ncbi:hypothetical protein MPH_13819 [Macrophomina phaseolina MS6]|uniref:Uncharacterized protein n=1 Tax=Macrophomina phaseolina (strain MS6) TaxID=1126212 RepID=K2QHE0_MACPH|nr:hypothetical protein MPH_13819 [Macrophomina phaseolina MS6]
MRSSSAPLVWLPTCVIAVRRRSSVLVSSRSAVFSLLAKYTATTKMIRSRSVITAAVMSGEDTAICLACTSLRTHIIERQGYRLCRDVVGSSCFQYGWVAGAATILPPGSRKQLGTEMKITLKSLRSSLFSRLCCAVPLFPKFAWITFSGLLIPLTGAYCPGAVYTLGSLYRLHYLGHRKRRTLPSSTSSRLPYG